MSDDLKRIEAYTATFEKAAVTIGFLLFLLALWVRTPHLQINLAAAAGFSGILGFNVGHAIVFGPVIVLLALGLYLSLLGRREALRQAFYSDLAAGVYGEDKLSGGSRLVLEKFPRCEAKWSLTHFVDRGTRALWFFILPIGVSTVCIRRYVDFIPEANVVAFAESKAWSLWTRIGLHLFSDRFWEVRAVLPDRYLDENPLVSVQMPYIYSPTQGWVYLVLLAASLLIAARSWALYFRAPPSLAGGMPVPRPNPIDIAEPAPSDIP